MPVLLYCVTQPKGSVSIAAGVCDSAVQSQELAGLRVYWSEIADPDACLGNAQAMKEADLQFRRVLREILAATTPLSFAFPTLLENGDAVEQYLSASQEMYCESLDKLGNAVQYEIIASWTGDEQADLATPVSGREYAKRRQVEMERIAAVDHKLRSVTGESVREWRTWQERRTQHWYALVPRDCRERFVASLRNAGASEGVRLRLSGPWPPNDFVVARVETHPGL
jgi:hypothetical protein